MAQIKSDNRDKMKKQENANVWCFRAQRENKYFLMSIKLFVIKKKVYWISTVEEVKCPYTKYVCATFFSAYNIENVTHN